MDSDILKNEGTVGGDGGGDGHGGLGRSGASMWQGVGESGEVDIVEEWKNGKMEKPGQVFLIVTYFFFSGF